MARPETVSVRLEGGIGDHILGMRVLSFIRRRFPSHEIIGYSDSSGSEAQIAVARMSKLFSKVVPVYHKKRYPTVSTWGSLENIDGTCLKMMRSADIFIDAWGQDLFIEASRLLDAPFNEILSTPPELEIPPDASKKADILLKNFRGRKFAGLDISKYDYSTLKRNRAVVERFIRELLKDKDAVILNFCLSEHRFAHWPKALGMEREAQASGESMKIASLWNLDKRVIPMVDLSIPVVAALLKRCGYFIGVDNGVKHLAWALGVPHTFFEANLPSNYFAWRWMPDYNRMLLFKSDENDIARHLSQARKCLKT